jgi:phage shock protein A
MFSLVKRLLRFFLAASHDVLDNIENAGATARQMVRDLGIQIAKMEEAVATVIADQNVLIKNRDKANLEAADWSNRAEQAVRAGRDDLATLALERGECAEKSSEAFARSLAILSPKVDALKANLDALRRKRDVAATEADVLDARAKAAQATERVARIMGNVGVNPINFDEVRARVDKVEAKADALNELAQGTAKADDITAELDNLGSAGVTTRLAALKKKVAHKLVPDQDGRLVIDGAITSAESGFSGREI